MDHSEVKHLPKVDHTPNEMDAASKLLLKAADLIETGGLCKGTLQDAASFCVVGAISYAAFGRVEPMYSRLMSECEAMRRMREAIGGGPFDAVDWNNHADRTAAEVVSKLRAVALGL